MNEYKNAALTGISQTLRKNMTKEECRLWYDFLKGLMDTVCRQKVFGQYILDFYCAAAKLAIELDGSQHYSKQGEECDLKRDEYLARHGIYVLRYSNLQVLENFSGVCQDILCHIKERKDILSARGERKKPSPSGEGGRRGTSLTDEGKG